MIGIILFIVLLSFIMLGAPISISMGLGVLAAAIGGSYDLSVIPNLICNGSSNYTLVAIPYFVLLGNLMNSSGISERIYDFADACVGHLKGGLAQVNVLGSVIFAGISGTAVADAAGLGLVEIKSMEKKGYPLDFSAAITAASSVLGPIIPPSVTLLIFASLTSASVAKLFVAGIVPGLLVALLLCLTNYYLYVTGKVIMPEPTEFSFKKVLYTIKRGFFALATPLVLLITMTSGVVTPTEAGIIGVVYAMFVGFIYKELTWENIKSALLNTVTSCALIMLLIGMGTAVGWFLTAERIPTLFANLLLGVTDNKIVLLIIMNIIMLILGMFMDGTTIQLIMVPLLMPLITSMGVDILQFGVMVTINILIGTVTPPFGTVLFVLTAVTGLSMEKLVKSILPFFIPLVIAMLIITYIPFFTTWLPGLL